MSDVFDFNIAGEPITIVMPENTAEAVRQRTLAEAAASASEGYRDEAQQALASAIAASNLYDDTTAGLAATSNGDYFSTPGDDAATFSILYLNDDGVATEIASYPTLNALDTPLEIFLPAPSGSDDTVAINALLAAVGSTPASFIARKGAQYVISDTIVVPSNTTLDLSAARVDQASGSSQTMICNAAWKAAWTNVTITWTAGAVASVAWTGHSLSVGDYVWLDGADQSHYRGVFPVLTVTDANNFTVALIRIPAVSPTTTTFGETIRAKKADTNIRIIGGDLDYDLDNNPDSGTSDNYYRAYALIMVGVQGLTIENYASKRVRKFTIAIGAVTDVLMRNIGFPNTASDGIKVFGPAFNGRIEGAHGAPGDDFISLQPREDSSFTNAGLSWGDVIGWTICSIRAAKSVTNGRIAVIYTTSLGPIIDDITFDGVHGRALDDVCGIRCNQSETNGICGTISFLNVTATGNQIFRTLNSIIQCVNLQPRGARTISASGNFITIDSGTTIRQMNVDWGVDMSSMTAPIGMNLAGTIEQINCTGWIKAPGGGKLIAPTTGMTLGQVNVSMRIEASTGWSTYYVGAVTFANAEGPQLNFDKCYLKGGNVVTTYAPMALWLGRNKINVASILLAGTNGGYNYSISYKTDQNQWIAGSWVTGIPTDGSVTINPFSDEVTFAVSAGYCGRPVGGKLNNNSTTAGTITTAGPVDCMGAGSNSWRRRGDPLAQQY